MPESSRHLRQDRSSPDVPAREVSLVSHLLAVIVLGVLISIVVVESAVGHRRDTEVADPTRIDLNYGSAEELESLLGIGPVLARAIIAARPFSSPDELVRVHGIGDDLTKRLRPLIKATPGRRAVDLR